MAKFSAPSDKDNLVLDKDDITRLLKPYLNSYLFHNKGKLPRKIVIVKTPLIEIQLERIPPKFETIPIVYEEVANSDDIANRPQRAKGDSKAIEPISPDSSVEPEPDTEE
jgi:hypothetical protein